MPYGPNGAQKIIKAKVRVRSYTVSQDDLELSNKIMELFEATTIKGDLIDVVAREEVVDWVWESAVEDN